MSAELRPCLDRTCRKPVAAMWDGSGNGYWQVRCACGWAAPRSPFKADAIANWNRRVAPGDDSGETWTCFHCGRDFDDAGAREHFGRRSASARPVCVALGEAVQFRLRGPFQTRKEMWEAINAVRTLLTPGEASDGPGSGDHG